MDSWHYDDVGEDDTETDSKFFGGKEAIIFLIDIASPGIKSLINLRVGLFCTSAQFSWLCTLENSILRM